MSELIDLSWLPSFCFWELQATCPYKLQCVTKNGKCDINAAVAYLAYYCSASAGAVGATWILRCWCCCWSLTSCCQDWESPLLCWIPAAALSCNAEWNFVLSPPPDGTLRHLNAAAARRPRLCWRCLQGLSEIFCSPKPCCLFDFDFQSPTTIHLCWIIINRSPRRMLFLELFFSRD